MKAKYAAAIRAGITAGLKTRYGDADDPHYEVRSQLINAYCFRSGEREYEATARLRELAREAFRRTWQRQAIRRSMGMTEADKREANRIFEERYARWVETPQQREVRQLRERVAHLLDNEVGQMQADIESLKTAIGRA